MYRPYKTQVPTPIYSLYSIFRRHPALRLTIGLITGILMAAGGMPIKPSLVIMISGGLLLTGLLLPLVHRLSFAAGPSVLTAIVFLGIGLYNLQLPRFQSQHFSHFLNDKEHVFLFGVEEVKDSRLIGVVKQLDRHLATNGRLVVHVKNELLDEDLENDIIAIRGRANSIQPPRNPASFDFAKFYRNKHVHFQCFIEGNQWQVIRPDEHRTRLNWFSKTRMQAKSLLQEHVEDKHAFALLSALLLGDKRSLDDEIKSAYADTGSMHVLAVSGLHLGILFLILSFGFRFLPVLTPTGRLIKTGLICLGIWSFAMLSGASNSVLRAATMFTFFAVGGLLGRGLYSINTLAAVAFILLMIDPLSLFDVGFQLSFSAVAGIILLQGEIEKLWNPPYNLFKSGWKLISLSFAAQLFTFPFVIYYFHQFPIYFWLSGIVVVPAAFVLLTCGFIFFAVHWIPFLGALAGFVLGGIAQFTNKIIFLIQKLPYVEVQGLWPDQTQLLLTAMVIMAITMFLKSKRGRYLVYSLSILLLLLLYNAIVERKVNNQSQLVVYYIPNQSYGELLKGRKVFRLKDSGLSERNQLFVVNPYREKSGIKLPASTLDENLVENYQGHFSIEGSEIYFSELDEKKGRLSEELGIIVIGNSFLENQLPDNSSAIFVLDSSLGYRQAIRWEKMLLSRNFRFHNIYRKGAFEFKLNKQST
ncbi:MAG: ComEC family competence protein [Saprospiraceae bacterium]|nr:ComEC family competence protein [Saprospiraceae bacterium]